MDFLMPDLGASFAALPLPKIRIKAGMPFAKPVRLQVPIPNLETIIPQGSEIAFIALRSEFGADNESIDTLAQIGGAECGNQTMACVTLLPEWFAQSNPADPNDPVLQIAVGFHSLPRSTLYLWNVPQDQVMPVPGTVTLSTGGTLNVSVRVLLQKNFSFTPGTPLLTDVVTSPFGPRLSPPGFHDGVDLAAANSTPVITVRDGTVDSKRYGFQQGTGILLCLDGTRKPKGLGNRFWQFHGDGGLQSLYGHLEAILATPGSTTVAGQQIALSDTTGGACGPHVHFGVIFLDQYIDPQPLLPTFDDVSLYLPYDLALTIDGMYVGGLSAFATAK
jgi:hypothetical protein